MTFIPSLPPSLPKKIQKEEKNKLNESCTLGVGGPANIQKWSIVKKNCNRPWKELHMIDCRPKFKIQKNWSYNWVTVTTSDSFITHGPTRAGVAARTSSTAGGHVARRCWGLIDIFILNVRTRPIFYILFSTLVIILFLMRNQNWINSSFGRICTVSS